ncbi:MAG: FAD-binding domain-containing protein [Sediminibacterium sp.]
MNISYAALLEQVKAYQPGKYNATRNYINGAVTNWSPYISRGLLSPVLVMDQLKKNYNKQEWIGFMQQMAWREYFQRVWQQKGDLILEDLKSAQAKVVLESLPIPISEGNTGIQALDSAIHHLYEKGMMHNHIRMYISMLHSNIFKAAWLPGAKWMYANLLDHDPAANFLSWQWVAGTFSSKQYIANQENINKYTSTKQLGTYLDTEYENLQTSIFDDSNTIQSKLLINWPNPLDQKFDIDVVTILKNIEKTNQSKIFDINQTLPNTPFCIYNSFTLDPLWQADESMNRILLLEPNHFEQFPVTEKVLQFIVDLAITNIPGIQIFIGNFEDLFKHIQTKIYFKEHPTTHHYKGIQETRDWLFPEVNGYFPSFFGYWKKCERYLK